MLSPLVYAGGLCAAADNKLHCFSLDMSAQPLKLSATLEVKQQGIADMCIRQDQRLFATAGWDGKIRVFHYKKRKALAVLHLKLCCVIEFCLDRIMKVARSGFTDNAVALIYVTSLSSQPRLYNCMHWLGCVLMDPQCACTLCMHKAVSLLYDLQLEISS